MGTRHIAHGINNGNYHDTISNLKFPEAQNLARQTASNKNQRTAPAAMKTNANVPTNSAKYFLYASIQ
ncbi:hypothetical protein, partial [Candidatus Kuenenia stuttgartiensis]|uniref:hypothetical protein n=1 Tax=Kuenenia stuttgartiensis TaxID=174633 RepID=UPI001E615B19